LIDIVGRSEALGRPLLYGTTTHFLEHFGFRSLEDLPRPEELPIILRDRPPLGIDGDDAEEDAQVPPALGEGEEGDAEQGHAQDAGADAEGEPVVEAGDAETAAAADADVEESSEGEEESADVEEPVIDEEPDDEEATSAPDASY
jgi:segregation and condensation protein B